jgi:hypothetical protein
MKIGVFTLFRGWNDYWTECSCKLDGISDRGCDETSSLLTRPCPDGAILNSTNPDFPLTTLRTYPPIHVLHAFVCSRGESGLTGIILSLSFPTKFRYLRDI